MAVAAQRAYRVRDYDGYRISKRKEKNSTRAISGVFVMLTAAVLIYLALFAGLVQAQYRVTSLRAKIGTAAQENKELRFTLLRLRAKDRIEKIARTELGMKEPGNVEFLEIP